MSESVQKQWDELKVMVELLDKDVAKHVSGNASAGVRARSGLRELRKVTTQVIKETLTLQKARDAAKKAAKAAKK